MIEKVHISELELEKLGFKSVGIGGCVFVLNNLMVQFYDYHFGLEINNHSDWIEIQYVDQLEKFINP